MKIVSSDGTRQVAVTENNELKVDVSGITIDSSGIATTADCTGALNTREDQ